MRLSKEELLREAKAFINQYYSENELDGAYRRWQEIEDEIALTGSYTHTFEELDYGAKLAWRNSNRCIGRLFWKTLKTIDAREVATAEEFEQALEHHLAAAEQRTKIRSTITVFAPLGSTRKEPFRIKNYTLLMYAGYREGDRSSPFWKEKALLVLNEAVYYSFEAAHATIVDHHKAADQFMKFVEQEQVLGREVTGEWSWLVPPTAGSTTAVFHTEMKDELKFPNFVGA